jgi:AP-3 complex subunit delta-1
MVFEKTLTDLVKGIRASKRDTALYISSCIAEIKSEINSTDPHTKANALQKLTFLQMMGYNMSWASFATIEVMSSPRFAHKRIGYLAASQAFTQDTDVILLTTNTLKKELRGAVGPGMNGVYEAGLAINCLSNIVTEDLARELLGDITNLTVHPQPYLRKKAILCLLKIFMKYPHALRLAFPRIQDCLLKDPNSSVTSCAVNVVTELSEVNPKNYLVLAPSFFQLLTSSSNNWMLIKVVKLFGTLVPEEPRLARKLLEPLAEIVKNTQAKSLLYEAVHTITLCLPYCRKADGSMPSSVPDIVALCAETLKSFIEETDQNLKYLGLVGFGSLMISHPKILSAPGYRPLILACLSDDDVTIRTRALDLLIGVATRKNIMDLVTQLLHHVDKASGGYKIDLVEKIVEMCSSDKYSLITDFAWYIDVLVILAKTKGLDGNGINKRNLGPLISNQISDVTLRVLPVRPYSVRRMIGIMLDGGNSKNKKYFSGTFGLETNATMMPEVLPVAAFVIGEYSTLIDEAVSMEIDEEDDDELFEYNDQSKGTYHAIIQALTDPSNIDMLALQTQSIYMQGALKVFAASTCSNKCPEEELEACIKHLSNVLPVYMQSMDAEVQERAFTAFHLLKSLGIPTLSPSMHTISESTISALDAEKNEKQNEKKTGDLLRLEVNVDTPKMTPYELSHQVSTTPHTFNVSKARTLSATLKYLFISEQMKPISSKAQRRKMASAPSNINSILEKENTKFFMNLLKTERYEENERGRTKNIDLVTFSQQLPLSEVSNKVSNKHHTQLLTPQIDTISNGDLGGTNLGTTMSSNTKQHDPFYLESQLKVNDDNSKPSNRFDTIQLLDNESDDSRTAKKSKRKKKSKKKDAASAIDLQFLSGLGSSTPSIPSTRSELPNVKQSLIDSDEDDDDEAPNLAALRAKEKVSYPSSKHKLANIDLTTPLREDELIPEPRHRVAQERPLATSNLEEPTARKKKKKKNKTATKDQVINNTSQDLLDLGNLDPGGKVENTSTMFSSTQSSNAINNAFDDLLSLNIPAPLPAPPLPSADVKAMDSISESVPNSCLRLWQKASLKYQIPTSSIDWENINVFYKMDSFKNNNIYLSLKLRKVSTAYIPNVIISLPGVKDLEIKQLSSDDDVHMEKLGPFPFPSSTLKGSIHVAGESSKLRISIPYTTNMSPLQLHKDDVTDLLKNGEWASESCKIELPVTTNEEELKVSLQHFLAAAEVIDSCEKSTFMLASVSKSGERAIFLVKKNTKGVKIDIKATDKTIAKSLASDLKKITLLI